MHSTQTVLRATARLYQRLSANLLLVLGFVALLYFLIHFTLNSPFALRAFDELVNSGIRGRIAWSRVSFGPLPWDVRIMGAELTDEHGQTVISVREVHVEGFDFSALLSGRIVAARVRIVAPVVRLEGRESHEAFDAFDRPRQVLNIERMMWPPDGPPEPSPPGRGIVLQFGDVSIQDARVALDLPDVHFALEDVGVEGARFVLNTADAEGSMTIGATLVVAREGALRLRAEPALSAGAPPASAEDLVFPISDFSGRHFQWGRSAFALTEVRLRVRGDPVVLRPLRLDLNGPGLPFLATSLSADFASLSAQLSPIGVTGVHGDALISLTGEGELDAFAARFTVTARDLVAEGYALTNAHVIGEIDADERVTIERLDAEGYGGRLRANAELALRTLDLFTRLDLVEIEPDTLPFDLPRTVDQAIAGRLTGRLRVSGRDLGTDDRSVSVASTLDLRRSGPSLYGLGQRVRAELLVNLARGVLDVRSADVEVDEDRLITRGQVDLRRERAKLEGSLVLGDTRAVAAAFGQRLSGALSVRYSVDGPWAKPRLTGRITGRRLRYDTMPPVDLDARVDYDGHWLELVDTQARLPNGSVGVRGRIGVGLPRIPLRVTVNARQLDLESLPLGIDVAGRVDADLSIEGNTRRPVIAGKARLSNPRYGQLAFRRLDVTGRYWPGHAEVEELLLIDDRRSRIMVRDFVFDLREETLAGHIEVDRLALEGVNQLVDEPLPIRGTVSVRLDLDGKFTDPRGEGEIALSGFGWDTFDLGDGDLKLTADAGMVRLQGRLFDTFDVRAQSPTAPGGPPASVSVSFRDLDLGNYVAALRDGDATLRLSGQVAGTADPFAGELQEIVAQLDAVELTHFMYDDFGRLIPSVERPDCADCPTVTVINHEPWRLRFADELLTLEALRLRGAGTDLKLSGTVHQTGFLDVSAAGRFGLGAVAPFLTGIFVRMEGVGELELTARGPVDDPALAGWVGLDRMELIPRSGIVGGEIRLLEPFELEVQTPYGPLDLAPGMDRPPRGVFQITLPPRSPRSGERNTVALRRDEGELEVTYIGLRFQEYAPEGILVELRGSDVGVVVPRTLRASADVPLLRFEQWKERTERRARETRMRISGDIHVIRGEYSADLFSTDDINRGVRAGLRGAARAREVSAFERVPALKRLMLDLRLRTTDDFFIRNRVTMLALALEIRSDLAVRGFLYPMPTDRPEDALAIAGFIEVLPESTINYSRRDFEVLQGEVSFGSGNPNDLETAGDFMLARVEASHTFRLRIDEGPATASFDRLGGGDVRLEEVTLTARLRMATKDSTPEIDLSFASSSGASKIEVATLVLTGRYPSGLSGASGAAPATEMLLGPLLGLIERPLEETLDIDLSLTPASTGTLFIDADKLLSRRLRLYTRTPVGNEDTLNPQTFGLEYRLNNVMYGDLTNQRLANLASTSGRLRLRLIWD